MGAALALIVTGCGPSADERQRAGAPDDAPPAWVELLSVDRAFADSAAAVGTRDALLGVLSESGILFRPAPVGGRSMIEEGPPLPGELEWSRDLVHLSRDGGSGFTSGPYRMSREEGQLVGAGRYVSIWRRRAQGDFALELTVRVEGPAADVRPGEARMVGPVFRRRIQGEPDETGLLGADETYRGLLGAGSVEGVRTTALHPDLHLIRLGLPPADGADALAADAARLGREDGITFQAQGARFADDGTMGYVYGMAAGPPPPGSGLASGPAGPFLHIWVRTPGGRWQLLLDLLGADPR